MNLFYKWVRRSFMPPRWMAFSFYQASKDRALFVIPPINLIIAFLWWIQDKWAMKAHVPSWIEKEVCERVEQKIKNRLF